MTAQTEVGEKKNFEKKGKKKTASARMINVDSDAALMATRLMEDTQSSSGDAFLREEMRHHFFFFSFFFTDVDRKSVV